MRVLFVNENVGGHATYHVNLAAALAGGSRLQAEFLSVPAPKLGRRILGAEIPGLARLDADFQRLRAVLAASALVRRRVRERLRRGEYDVIHVMSQNAALTWTDVLRDMPSVVALDSTNVLNAYTGFRAAAVGTRATVALEQVFERRVYSAATLVAPLSEWASTSLRRMGVPAKKIRVVPFGVPVIDPTFAEKPRERPEIVFVGLHLARKGGLLLLELYARHLAERCTLTLVTPEPVPPAPGLRVISDIRPGDGRLDQVLSRASVFVFPSVMDQSPNVVLEAMAAGLPVVAFGAGAIPEMVGDGIAGRIVPPGDSTALVDAIRSLLDDPEGARRMGQAGRRRVETLYDARTVAGLRIDVLAEAIARFTGSTA